MDGNKFSFIFMDIVLLVVLLGLTAIIFDTGGLMFKGQLILLALFIFAALISMAAIYADADIGWAVMSIALLLILCDIIYMYLKGAASGRMFYLTLIFSSIGFLASTLKIKSPEDSGNASEIKPEIVDMDKYVASKTGKKYHRESCDWAKKINPVNRVSLTQDEANTKGLKACHCVGK